MLVLRGEEGASSASLSHRPVGSFARFNWQSNELISRKETWREAAHTHQSWSQLTVIQPKHHITLKLKCNEEHLLHGRPELLYTSISVLCCFIYFHSTTFQREMLLFCTLFFICSLNQRPVVEEVLTLYFSKSTNTTCQGYYVMTGASIRAISSAHSAYLTLSVLAAICYQRPQMCVDM